MWIAALSGSTIGLLVSACGAMGVNTTALTTGCTMGPPAERLYAVDPVAVATISPSARNRATNWFPTETDKSRMPESALFVMTTSLSTICSSKVADRRSVRDRSIRRSSIPAVPSTAEASASNNSGKVISVKNPRLPKLTARIGGSALVAAI